VFWQTTLALTIAGLPGIVAVVLTLPRDITDKIPIANPLVKRLAVGLQPTVLLIIGAAIGSALTREIGSVSLIANMATGAPQPPDVIGPFVAAAAGGVILGGLLYLVDRMTRGLWASEGEGDLISEWRPAGIPTGLLYGGITEEVLMRWGVMSLFLWLAMLALGSDGIAADIAVWIAIVLSALLFAVGHLPAALATGRKPGRFVGRIIILNFLAGLVFGWLFARYNLETAMAAHASFHVGGAIIALLLRRRPATASR